MVSNGRAPGGFRTRVSAVSDRFVTRLRLSGMRGTGIDRTANGVVVTGPPGSGKATLLAQWSHSLRRAGWVSWSEGDDSRSIGQTVLSTLPILDFTVAPGCRFDLECLTDFACTAERLGEPVWVFLDEIRPRRTHADACAARLHRTTARSYAAHDDLPRGVEHALAGNDTVQVADFIEGAGPGLLLSGQASRSQAGRGRANEGL